MSCFHPRTIQSLREKYPNVPLDVIVESIETRVRAGGVRNPDAMLASVVRSHSLKISESQSVQAFSHDLQLIALAVVAASAALSPGGLSGLLAKIPASPGSRLDRIRSETARASQNGWEDVLGVKGDAETRS